MSHDGALLTNFDFDTVSNVKELNSLLKNHNIHFIYLNGKDVSFKFDAEFSKPILFPANKVSFFSQHYSDDECLLESTDKLNISILSLNTFY